MKKKQKAKKLYFKPPEPIQNMTDGELDTFSTAIYDSIMTDLLGDDTDSQDIS